MSDLNAAGQRLKAARQEAREALSLARLSALADLEAGMSEYEAARSYGVTRMTIRAWRANKGEQ